MRFILLTISIVCLLAFQGSSQVIQPGDLAREYYDLLSLQNSTMPKPITFHPSIISQYYSDSILKWNIWSDYYQLPKKIKKKSFQIVDPWLSYNGNSKIPYGYNDGAMWSGKGSNFLISGGFTGNIGILNFAFIPNYSWSQNKSFDIPDNVTGADISEFSYPFSNRIDFVQRFGTSSYSQFQLGQSELRIVHKKMTIGVSTENFKLGPSIWNPILMSTNAAGIPHMDIGTAVPIETKIGKIEGRWFMGITRESDYFDSKKENDRKYLTGFTIGYEPLFAPGLSLGINRVMYTRWNEGDLSKKDFFAAFLKNKANDMRMKNDEYDQLMSAMMKYRFPEVGFEMYVEYARNDFPGNINDLYKQIDRSRALVWGVMKTYELKKNKLLKLNYEFTTLSANQTQIPPDNASPPFYIHSVVDNGYTHQGQILGAGIGPGSNGSILTVDVYSSNGKYGFMMSRKRFNDDYFVNAYASLPEPYPFDYDTTMGVNYLRNMDKFSVYAQISWNRRKNWFYEDNRNVNNYLFSLQLLYKLNDKK